MRFGVRLWCHGLRRRIKLGDQWLVWWKGAGWTFWWIDVRTRDYWSFRKHFVKYHEFEWVNRELLSYRHAAHLAGVRVELFRGLGNLAGLRRERTRLCALRARVRYWEDRARERRRRIADGTQRFI
jgi:hypothetical protein